MPTPSLDAFRDEPDQYEAGSHSLAAPEPVRMDRAADPRQAAIVLGALAAMAARNRRGEADLFAALRGAGLTIDHARLELALEFLHAEGCVTNIVPLSDGDVLMKVTGIKPRPG